MRGDKVSTFMLLPKSTNYCPHRTQRRTVLVHYDRSGDLMKHSFSFIITEVREKGKYKAFSWLCKVVEVPWEPGQWLWATKVRDEVSQDKEEECEGLGVLEMQGELMAF